MEFRSSNEKGAAAKSAAPHRSFLRLLTSGCQEVIFTVDASDCRGHRNSGGNPDDHSSRVGRSNVDEAVPIGPFHANPDLDDMDPDPIRIDKGEVPNLDPSSGRHPIDCC